MISHTPTKKEKDRAMTFAKAKIAAKSKEVLERGPNPTPGKPPWLGHYYSDLVDGFLSDTTGVPKDRNVYPHGDDCDLGPTEVRVSTHRQNDIELKVPVEEYAIKKPWYYVLARIYPKQGDRFEVLSYISWEDFDKYKERKTYPKQKIKNFVVGTYYTTPLTLRNVHVLSDIYKKWVDAGEPSIRIKKND